MEQTEYKIEDLTVEKLKALLYDEVKLLQQIQNNITQMEQVLQVKLQKETTENLEEVKEGDNLVEE